MTPIEKRKEEILAMKDNVGYLWHKENLVIKMISDLCAAIDALERISEVKDAAINEENSIAKEALEKISGVGE